MQQKIKILQFPIANTKGGTTQYILRNWEVIDKTCFQFDFATMSKSLDFVDELKKEGCKIYYISCYAEDNKEQFINEFTKILKEGNYDIVHLHTNQWKSFLVEQIAKKVGVKKIIVHAHNTGIGTLDEEKRTSEIKLHNQMLEQLTENIATDYWACSSKAAEFLFGNKISNRKIRIMNNAIDLSKYAFDKQIREEYRKKLNIEEEEYVIGCIGRLSYQKNQEFLISVFKELCSNYGEKGKKYRLLLVGAGECEEKYKEIVCENKLENKIIFTGYRADIPRLLQAMDIFCLPSRFEGLGMVLIEAQASGLPCIISEGVPKDGVVNDNVYSLPLEIILWKEKILEYDETYHRAKTIKLAQNGYDIFSQIKILENYYKSGLI